MQTFDVNIPGFTIACKAFGDKKLPPLLALHGWLDNANSFELLAPFLAEHFYVIAIDLPGHGLSSHLPPGSHYHIIDGLFCISRVMSALHIKNFHLLGHSMGACLASLLAGIIPERIQSLILIEGLGPFSSPENTCQMQLAHYLKQHVHETKPKSYATRELATHARAKSGHLSLAHAALLSLRGVKENAGEFYWCHDRRLVAPSPLQLTEGQILSCLSTITAKTCLIIAKKGFQFDAKLLRTRIECIPHIHCFEVEGGHHIHMENPALIKQCLINASMIN